MSEGLNNKSSRPEAGPQASTPDDVAKSPSRRAMVKAGLLAAPLVMTLRSRPALGQTQQAALGSLGITYGPGAYLEVRNEETGETMWAPVDHEGEIPLTDGGTATPQGGQNNVSDDDFNSIDKTRRHQRPK